MNMIGCDYHPSSESIAMLDVETGEVVEKRLAGCADIDF